ncbi:TetR/AcrR family transcriptional regulator [Microbacterium protaetiae]|uniref:TetR/AcrR family transcriptional regulator n=1 Tax=Microbacterium protaetiae TaxID=2509458 RepID=A0A4P6ECS7_9MICO|nr:TetR/AcrR family transcriptional regulator [Microbacterium protaetiae]QAY60040.1 TetR/AcrR family transcriptional regulator [Microbacterium protaetiae]
MEDEPSSRPAGRPRDPGVAARVLTAVQDLLITNGYAGTTIAAVAQAAGTGKAAVYRRWSGKADLVVAAVLALNAPVSVPDTGSLRDDLVECAMHYARGDERATRVLASLLSEIGHDPQLFDAANRAIGRPPVAALVAVIEQWVRRGAISADVPTELIAGIIPTAAFGSVTLRQRTLDTQTISDLVDHVLLPALTGAHGSSTQLL